VSLQINKYLLAVAMVGAIGSAPTRMLGQTQAAPAKGPQWKDRAEYDLFESITKDTNPKTKLDKLQDWEKKYPKTDYNTQRQTLLLTTYAALNQPKQTVDEAREILSGDPKNFTAQYYTMFFTQALYTQNQSPTVLDQGEKAAQAILAGIDTPPANVTAAQWASLRPDIELMAHRNLGFIAMQRKNWEGAEAEFKKTLQMHSDDGQVDYWLGTVIAAHAAAQKKLDELPEAMFYFARAAEFDGPKGSLNEAGRKTALDYVQKQYKNYHGSDQGFSDLVAAAKANPMMPAGFTIESATAIATQQIQNENAWEQSHPQEALWKKIMMALTGPDGATYFDMSMKGAAVPELKGKVVKLEPATRPKTILLAMDDGSGKFGDANATLKFEMPLPGKVDEGTELSFEGVPDSYTANPLMVIFNVDKDKLTGWTGKNEAPVHHRRAADKK